MPDRTRVRALTVVLTSNCQLRCAYCYQNAKHSAVMEWATLEAALSMAVRSVRRSVSITFTGGEALMQFDRLERAIEYVLPRRREHQRIDFYLVTNGMRLGLRESRFLAQAEVNVQSSMDGVPAAQASRGARTFRVLDELLDRLRRDHPRWFDQRVSIGAVVTAGSMESLPESVEYFLSKGVKDIVLGPALTFQPTWSPRRIADLERRMTRVLRTSLEHFGETGEIPVRLFRTPYRGDDVSECSPRLCAAGRPDSLTVDVDGQVTGCPLFVQSYQRFPDTPLGQAMGTLQAGRVDDGDLVGRLTACRRRIDATGLFSNRSLKRSSYGRCGTCRYRRDCSLCPVTIVHQPGNADPNRVPDFACAFNRVAGKLRAGIARGECRV